MCLARNRYPSVTVWNCHGLRLQLHYGPRYWPICTCYRVGMCVNLHAISVKVQPCTCGFSFLSRVSKHLPDFFAVDCIVVSAITIFRLVDNLRPHLCIASLRLLTDLITRSIHLQSQTVTPVWPWSDRLWMYDLPDLRALLGFEHWQSIYKGLPLGVVKDHLGSIGGVEAGRMDVVLDGISPSSFGATSWSFPSMNVSYMNTSIIKLSVCTSGAVLNSVCLSVRCRIELSVCPSGAVLNCVCPSGAILNCLSVRQVPYWTVSLSVRCHINCLSVCQVPYWTVCLSVRCRIELSVCPSDAILTVFLSVRCHIELSLSVRCRIELSVCPSGAIFNCLSVCQVPYWTVSVRQVPYWTVCLFVRCRIELSVCPSGAVLNCVCPSGAVLNCLSVRQVPYWTVCLSVRCRIELSVCLSVRCRIKLSVCPSGAVLNSVCLSVRCRIELSVCTSSAVLNCLSVRQVPYGRVTTLENGVT